MGIWMRLSGRAEVEVEDEAKKMQTLFSLLFVFVRSVEDVCVRDVGSR